MNVQNHGVYGLIFLSISIATSSVLLTLIIDGVYELFDGTVTTYHYYSESERRKVPLTQFNVSGIFSREVLISQSMGGPKVISLQLVILNLAAGGQTLDVCFHSSV